MAGNRSPGKPLRADGFRLGDRALAGDTICEVVEVQAQLGERQLLPVIGGFLTFLELLHDIDRRIDPFGKFLRIAAEARFDFRDGLFGDVKTRFQPRNRAVGSFLHQRLGTMMRLASRSNSFA